MTRANITEEILALPSASRALLAEKLVESLEFDTEPAIQAAWTTEAKKRRDQVRDGTVQLILGEEAMAQVNRSISSTILTSNQSYCYFRLITETT